MNFIGWYFSICSLGSSGSNLKRHPIWERKFAICLKKNLKIHASKTLSQQTVSPPSTILDLQLAWQSSVHWRSNLCIQSFFFPFFLKPPPVQSGNYSARFSWNQEYIMACKLVKWASIEEKLEGILRCATRRLTCLPFVSLKFPSPKKKKV